VWRSNGKGDKLRADAEEWLVDWFVARQKIKRDSHKGQSHDLRNNLRNTDYFNAGWLTSMEVVEFVTEIEQHFEMQFTDSDLQDSRFVTIAGLAELILERSTQTSESR
jgi:acyl carrier protein